MRPFIIALSLAASLPGEAEAAASGPAPDQAGATAEAEIVRHADGSFTIPETILPFPDDLDAPTGAAFRAEETERAAPRAGGEPRGRGEQETDEALDEAFEEAVALARQEAGPD